VSRPSPRALAVVVLYRENASESRTIRCLQQSFAAEPQLADSIFLHLYENSPEPSPIPPELFARPFHLSQPRRNNGIASAYNEALRLAQERGIEWLLLLDSDTEVTPAFLESGLASAARLEDQGRVAVIVPHIVEGEVVHAPRWVGPLRRDPVPLSFHGLAEREIVSVNSGCWVRVSVLTAAGGFNPKFWLDYLDYWLFRHLYRNDYKAFIMDQKLQHSLSFADPVNRMTLERYRNMLKAEKLFTRDYGSPWERFRRRLVLLKRAARFALVNRRREFVYSTLRHLLEKY
jgi:GT2 family glycosyltransferase